MHAVETSHHWCLPRRMAHSDTAHMQYLSQVWCLVLSGSKAGHCPACMTCLKCGVWCCQAARQGARDSWSSWNPQRHAAHDLQQLVQSGQISLQDTISAQRQTGSHSKHEPLPGSIPVADAEARGWVGHPKPFAWPAAKDAQVGLLQLAEVLHIICVMAQFQW